MPYDTDMQEIVTLPSDAGRFIPQKPPFVFVSALTAYGKKHAETRFDVPDDCVLAENGLLREGGLVELMAQSCAAYVGYRDFLSGAVSPLVGVLGALSSVRTEFLPPVGAVLSCKVEVVGDFDGLSMFYARVSMDGRLVSEGRLTTSGVNEENK